MKLITILTILLTLNTSFMSKTDLYVICKQDHQEMVVAMVDSKNRPIYCNNDNACMTFVNEIAAQQFITTLEVEVGFVGTRPIRR